MGRVEVREEGGTLLRGLLTARRGVCEVGTRLGNLSLRLGFGQPFLRSGVRVGVRGLRRIDRNVG